MPRRWVVAVWCSTASLMASAVHPQPARPPVIDMHLHSQVEVWAERRLCFPQPCEGLPSEVTEAGQLRAAALSEMDEFNVVLAVVSGSREEVLPWTEDMQDRFLTGLGIGGPDDIAFSDLKHLFESGRVQVLGEVWSQYRGIPIDDPSMDRMLSLAHELDVPVHVHVAGLGGSEDFPIHLGNPLRVAKVLRKYPGLRVYLENAGWPFLEEVTSLMYQYPYVYADISTILHLTPRPVAYRYLKGLVDNGLAKRLMYGSDQMIWPEVIGETIQAIENADFLSAEQKRDILYNNAARFLRLTEEQIAAHHAAGK